MLIVFAEPDKNNLLFRISILVFYVPLSVSICLLGFKFLLVNTSLYIVNA